MFSYLIVLIISFIFNSAVLIFGTIEISKLIKSKIEDKFLFAVASVALGCLLIIPVSFISSKTLFPIITGSRWYFSLDIKDVPFLGQIISFFANFSNISEMFYCFKWGSYGWGFYAFVCFATNLISSVLPFGLLLYIYKNDIDGVPSIQFNKKIYSGKKKLVCKKCGCYVSSTDIICPTCSTNLTENKPFEL